MFRLYISSVLVSAGLMPGALFAQGTSTASDTLTVEARYTVMSEGGDYQGLVTLWRENPDAALPLIDGDLEGSLALWEAEGESKRVEIDEQIARAIIGAEAAFEATGRSRVIDYVTSFAGWTTEQRTRFREGQGACREGAGALQAGDTDRALEKGGQCRALAEPLGDWWGTAMGLRLEGTAQASRGEAEQAATSLAEARLIFRELGLTSSAVRIEADLASILLELGRRPRARAMICDGRLTATRLGIPELEARFQELEEQMPGLQSRPCRQQQVRR